jgi:hypothetical protein
MYARVGWLAAWNTLLVSVVNFLIVMSYCFLFSGESVILEVAMLVSVKNSVGNDEASGPWLDWPRVGGSLWAR